MTEVTRAGSAVRVRFDDATLHVLGGMAKWEGPEPCGLGICSANAGHDGSCAEASGWTDDDWVPPPRQVVTASYSDYSRRWRLLYHQPPFSYRVWARIAAAGTIL